MFIVPLLAALILLLTVLAIARRVDARLALLAAGTLLATLAGQPLAALDTFTRAMVAPMVAPICASMGFAAVLAATGCDRALVQVLVAPLRVCRWLAVPGAVLAAYAVNLAVPSQASTAAALGPILLPLLTGAGCTPEAAGAALLLGASFGGDLLQPGAQDLQAVAGATAAQASALHAQLWPASLTGLSAAALVAAVTLRPSAAPRGDRPSPGQLDAALCLRAAVPLLPVVALLLAYANCPGLHWLVAVPAGEGWQPFAGALPVVRAMLLGCAVATLAAPRRVSGLAQEFFAGMGRAYTSIIALTISAQVFGTGLAASGLSTWLLAHSERLGALPALALLFPAGLAAISGSGSGPVLAFAQTFLAPMPAGPALDQAAVLSCFGGAFGRTISPVAAVTVCVAGFVQVSPLALVRRAAVPLSIGAAVALAVVLTR